MLHVHKTQSTLLKRYEPGQGIRFCKTCKHYKNGLCNKFIAIDLLDGIQAHVTAYEARSSDELCGKKGIYHEQINNATPSSAELSHVFQNPSNDLPHGS